MLKHVRFPLQILLVVVSALALTACFTSQEFFKEQRLWDPAWAGRYEMSQSGMEYVVLAADPTARTYLIAQFEHEKKELKTFRGALYPGWDDVLILGTLETGLRAPVNYHIVRRIADGRFEVIAPSCDAKTDVKGKDPCSYASIDALRTAVKPAYADTLARAKRDRTPILVERVKQRPLSTLGTATTPATFEDGDGVHGALRLANNANDLIIAVNGEEATSAAALHLMIALEKPGTKLRLTLLNPKTNTRRDITHTTTALPTR